MGHHNNTISLPVFKCLQGCLCNWFVNTHPHGTNTHSMYPYAPCCPGGWWAAACQPWQCIPGAGWLAWLAAQPLHHFPVMTAGVWCVTEGRYHGCSAWLAMHWGSSFVCANVCGRKCDGLCASSVKFGMSKLRKAHPKPQHPEKNTPILSAFPQ